MFIKISITFLMLIAVQLSFSQFTDHFSDNNFTNNPIWNGDVDEYEVNQILQLQLNAPAQANTSYLSTPSIAINNATWEFWVQFNFNPSSNNYARVYLVSDQSNLEGPLNGYFVQIGNRTDEISLYRQDGLIVTEIIDGIDGRVATNPVKIAIKVTRDDLGNWELLADTIGGTNYFSEGTEFDDHHKTTAFFGVFSSYTSSRSNHFFYDNFKVTGTGYIDVTPPRVDSLVVIDPTQLAIYFDESVNEANAETVTNYFVDLGIGAPVAAVRHPTINSLVNLTFSNTFINGQAYELTITNVKDTTGNTINSMGYPFTYLRLSKASFGNIVINELLFDPSPSVGLPSADYLELYNNTDKIIDLTNYWIADLTSSDQLNEGIILPHEYVIVCDNSVESQFSSFGKVITVNNFPSLNNTEDEITLFDADSNRIHTLHYFGTWYRNNDKKEGGWSIEMIDPNNFCGEANNWIASTDPRGGTPGSKNTAYGNNPDVTSPELYSIEVLNDSTLVLTFSEFIHEEELVSAVYIIDNGILINSLQVIDPKNVQINLTDKLWINITYSITVTGVNDCVGNEIGIKNALVFALPEQGIKEDIIINEVLFNPFEGGADFVEIYNNSHKTINLAHWSLANLEDDSINNHQTLTDQFKFLFPGEFVVLTDDVANIAQQYLNSGPSTFLQMENLPTYSNDKGAIYLVNNLNEVIDDFHYTEDMHFPLLNSVEGVSLERLNYYRPTNEITNWHSAAENVGWATPGIENSQFQSQSADEGPITIYPKTFSPNNDGVDDVVNIAYHFLEAGFVANIFIYDDKGRLIKHLVKNELLGVKGTYNWDGINANAEKASIGIYIVYVELFNTQGSTENFKRTIVLAGKLD